MEDEFKTAAGSLSAAKLEEEKDMLAADGTTSLKPSRNARDRAWIRR